jgi:hypothetical protein
MNGHQFAMTANLSHTRTNERLNLRTISNNDCIVRLKRPHTSSDDQLGGPAVHLDFKDLGHTPSLTDL